MTKPGTKPKLCSHGILGIEKCEECRKLRNRAWHERNKERIKAYAIKQHIKHSKQEVEDMRKRRELDKQLTSKKDKAHNFTKRHPEECPLASGCELCPEDDKATEGLIRHHPDYDYPTIYVAVCTTCHYFAEKTTTEVKINAA